LVDGSYLCGTPERQRDCTHPYRRTSTEHMSTVGLLLDLRGSVVLSLLLRWLVSSFVRTCLFFRAYQIFLDGQEHTAALGSGSSILHFGLTRHMSSSTLYSEAMTAESIAPGYGRFLDSPLQRRRFTSCASVRLLHRDALTTVQCPLLIS
jgi:hypothetical protein